MILGFDPTPAGASALVELSETLRKVIRALVEARGALDGLGQAGSVWDGSAGAPIATLLRRYSTRLSMLEESLVACLQAVDGWREGSEERQDQVADIVASVADLGGQAEAVDRRSRLIDAAREIGVDHDRAAADLVVAFEELGGAVEQIVRADEDFAGELNLALVALTAAVDEWIEAEGAELLRTAISLGEVAGLTTVISELVGIAALGRNPDEASGVREVISRSPGSHRLIRALRKQWLEAAPATLPEATFTIYRSGALADALAGRRVQPERGRGDDVSAGHLPGSDE